jgi:hypothetical protein
MIQTFKMGDYVEIMPSTEIDHMMKRNGVPNVGIVVASSKEENAQLLDDEIEIWREEIAEMSRTRTARVKASQVVLLKRNDGPDTKGKMAKIL